MSETVHNHLPLDSVIQDVLLITVLVRPATSVLPKSFSNDKRTFGLVGINLDVLQRQAHPGDTDEFLSDIKVIFAVTESQGATKICQSHFTLGALLWVSFGLFPDKLGQEQMNQSLCFLQLPTCLLLLLC